MITITMLIRWICQVWCRERQTLSVGAQEAYQREDNQTPQSDAIHQKPHLEGSQETVLRKWLSVCNGWLLLWKENDENRQTITELHTVLTIEEWNCKSSRWHSFYGTLFSKGQALFMNLKGGNGGGEVTLTQLALYRAKPWIWPTKRVWSIAAGL